MRLAGYRAGLVVGQHCSVTPGLESADVGTGVRHLHSELAFLRGEDIIVSECRVTRAPSVAVRDSLQFCGRVSH